jgi:hypothetical protein
MTQHRLHGRLARLWIASHKRAKPGLSGGETGLCRGFQLGIEVSDDVLECRDRLLDRRNLDQLPAADRGVAILHRDDQIPALLLKLNKR